MTRSLQGTVALVTGASSGIGEATARSLASAGAAVALAARRTERIEKLARALGTHGARALALTTDVTIEHEAREAVNERSASSDVSTSSSTTPA
jgi:NADP-dependent 3-hydroxy acid dehydrogenase YdfG